MNLISDSNIHSERKKKIQIQKAINAASKRYLKKIAPHWTFPLVLCSIKCVKLGERTEREKRQINCTFKLHAWTIKSTISYKVFIATNLAKTYGFFSRPKSRWAEKTLSVTVPSRHRTIESFRSVFSSLLSLLNVWAYKLIRRGQLNVWKIEKHPPRETNEKTRNNK